MDSRREALIIKEFGKRLKKVRKAKGLSLRKLAMLAEMNYGNIHKIEKGEINPQISTVILLAEALGIPPSDLLPSL
jgi:transcriptional regulator with XRE-family HTH domain